MQVKSTDVFHLYSGEMKFKSRDKRSKQSKKYKKKTKWNEIDQMPMIIIIHDEQMREAISSYFT